MSSIQITDMAESSSIPKVKKTRTKNFSQDEIAFVKEACAEKLDLVTSRSTDRKFLKQRRQFWQNLAQHFNDKFGETPRNVKQLQKCFANNCRKRIISGQQNHPIQNVGTVHLSHDDQSNDDGQSSSSNEEQHQGASAIVTATEGQVHDAATPRLLRPAQGNHHPWTALIDAAKTMDSFQNEQSAVGNPETIRAKNTEARTLTKLVISEAPRATIISIEETGTWHTKDLVEAARRNDVAELRRLLDEGADINGEKHGWTPLRAAALHGHVDFARFLLDHGADVNAKNNWGATALIAAAQNGDVDVARLLLDRDADVNAKSKDEWTALIRAARFGHVDVARLLLDRGANVNAKTYDGSTALILAAKNGDVDAARLLLDHGVTDREQALKYTTNYAIIEMLQEIPKT